jgi:hypothetical protein
MIMTAASPASISLVLDAKGMDTGQSLPGLDPGTVTTCCATLHINAGWYGTGWRGG